MTVDDCPFCEIVEWDDPDAREVFRDADVVAFFPTEPATLGHTLIVPRVHVPTIWDLQEPEAHAIATATLRLAHAIREAVSPDGLNIIQSNGDAATQTVPHIHVHLVPRWDNDSIGRIWPPETDYSERQKDDVRDRIVDALRHGGASTNQQD